MQPIDSHLVDTMHDKAFKAFIPTPPMLMRHTLAAEILGVESTDSTVLKAAIYNGRIQTVVIDRLASAYHTSKKDMLNFLSLTSSTVSRWKDNNLPPLESERAVRYALLVNLAADLFGGNADEAADWLNTPLPILSNESPAEHAKTEIGAREVEDLIGRLRHGVYS